MRIAYVTADHGAPVFGNKGASVHIRELVNAFEAIGHRVTVFAARRGDATGTLRAEVVEVPGQVSPPPQWLRQTKERLYLGHAARIRDCLVGLHVMEPFDMIYERYSLWSAAGIRAARELGIPCFVEVNAPLVIEQQTYRELDLASEAESVEAEVFHGADTLLAVSEQVRDYALAKGADPARTFVLPNGVDLARFNPGVNAMPVDGVAADAFVIGFVGSLKDWHGIETLLESFRTLRQGAPDCHLLIVGNGPMRGWIDGYVRGSRLDGAVTVTGWLSHDSLPGLIQRMDVAVAPYPMLEGFYFSPLKLYEYLAVGKPVAASAIGQVREVIADGVTGLLACPGDPDDLAAKIDRLHRDSDLRRTLGQAAARRARAYTWNGNAQRVTDLAGSLSGGPRFAATRGVAGA
jgi:glycosyltransferase involved in cell wall biosynthesis